MKANVSKDLVKSIKNDYFRTWREKNKQKVKQAQEKYWQKRAILEQQKGEIIDEQKSTRTNF